MILIYLLLVWLIICLVVENFSEGMGTALFLLVPAFLLYGLIWLIYKALHSMFPYWVDDPTVDDVIL